MTDFKQKISQLMQKNRRTSGAYQYTLPSPRVYPYQWFWDSCFHAIILSHFDIPAAQKELLSIVSRQFQNGMIPHMIYWQKPISTDFPVIKWGKKGTSTITQPPMLAYAVWQIYKKSQDKAFVKTIYPYVVKYSKYLLNSRDPHRNNLISLVNPDESGEDNSPRFDMQLGLPSKQTAAENLKRRLELVKNNNRYNFNNPEKMRNIFWVKDVPMNVILVENLKIMSNLAILLGKEREADLFFKQSQIIQTAMRELMLENSIYWSLYLDSSSNTYKKIKIKTWAMFAPLFAQILTKEEAANIIENYLLNKKEFRTKFLVPTVSCSESSFDPTNYWRGPLWIAINWFIVKGLQKYGYFDVAEEITDNSLKLIEKSGFREQFNPLTGEGLGADHFTWGGLVIDMQLA